MPQPPPPLRTSLPFAEPRTWSAATVGALAAGAVLVAVVGWWLVRPAPAPVEATVPLAGSAPPASTQADGGGSVATSEVASTTTTAEVELVVQAAGAVRSPGVHRLRAGSRLEDLVRAAGGFTPEADRDRVNLAALLVDGERIWIPRRGEADVPSVVAGSPGGGGGGASGGPDGASGGPAAPAGPVDLNAATAEQLDALPGVGPATAAAILAHRDEVGRFEQVDDLLDVRGIGEAKLEQIRPLVTV